METMIEELAEINGMNPKGANLGEVGKKEPPKGSATAKYRAITSNIRDASTTSNERTIDDSEGTVAKRQK